MVQIWRVAPKKKHTDWCASFLLFVYTLDIFLLITLCCVNGSDQKFFYFNTLIKNGGILIISAFNKQFKPIFTFGTFFQRNLQFAIKSALLCAKKASRMFAPMLVPERTSWLVRIDSFFSLLTSLHTLIIRKANAIDLSINGLAIRFVPFVTYLFTIHYYFLLSKNRTLVFSEEWIVKR